MANNENKTDVVVLGAGIVGVSAAYAARQRGLSVIVVDRREPGSETSYGNAGILSSGSIFPLNQPSLFGKLAEISGQPARRVALEPGLGAAPSRLGRALSGERASVADQAACAGPARPDQRVA